MNRLAVACVLALLTLGLSGCMSSSLNLRPYPTDEGKLRLGVGQGFTRDVATDFAFAKPNADVANRGSMAWLTEVTAHYGVAKHMDVGVRVRPLAKGAKLESQIQLFDPRGDLIGVSIGAGIDSFYRTRLKMECEAGGCFYREYAGMMADLPIVISARPLRWATLFVAARAQYLLIEGQQSYEPEDDSFQTLRQKKHIREPIVGFGGGVEFNWGKVRLVPQAVGQTVKFPKGKQHLLVYPSLDFAVQF